MLDTQCWTGINCWTGIDWVLAGSLVPAVWLFQDAPRIAAGLTPDSAALHPGYVARPMA